MARIQCHIIRVAEANGATSCCLVSVKTWRTNVLLHTGWSLGSLRLSQGTQTRQKHSGHWVLSIHEMNLNKLKMQQGLVAQKDYWNCYCELRYQPQRLYLSWAARAMRKLPATQSSDQSDRSSFFSLSTRTSLVVKQLLSFIYSEQCTVCQLKGSQHSSCCQPMEGKVKAYLKD
jgi:hypothetical protein